MVRVISSYPALRTRSLWTFGAPASTLATNRVPTHTPAAPYDSAAASPRPSAIPPAATTKTGWPVRGLLAPLQRSTTAGMRIEKGVSPVWPPPSPPCAHMMSTPERRGQFGGKYDEASGGCLPWASAFGTCLGWPTMLRERPSRKHQGSYERQGHRLHDYNSSRVELVDHLLGWDADCADE